ncbi:aldehyde dehydrogenase, partial [Burkholderia sp. Se-20378]|nr:aldehyde dehydrogenase [Burkholderia sp. Se-20378]
MNHPTFEDWQARAAVLRVEGRAFIDGEARHAHTGATFACVSPIDGGVLAHG